MFKNVFIGLFLLVFNTVTVAQFMGGFLIPPSSSNSPSYPLGTVHCSSTPTEIVDVTNPITGKTWMDRNLGASRAAISSTDADAYGDLYQWGRNADGHQCRNSVNWPTTSNSDSPSHGNFIFPCCTPFDWRLPQNTNLWQGINGINNPCPNGYRLPTDAELNSERSSWSSNDLAGAFSSALKISASGNRLTTFPSISGVGTISQIWSSNVQSVNSLSLFISNSNSEILENRRSNGLSIRCIKDAALPVGSVSALDCNGSTTIGVMIDGTPASGVSAIIPYTGGNGGTYIGQTVNSTGVSGLTATLTADTFANGAGNLIYDITGTPNGIGMASFILNVGGQSCTLVLAVNAPAPTYPPGTVHCSGTPTEIVDVTNPITGKTWMDRNLGASRAAISSTDAQAYGDLYQWGRRSDGHQCRTSPTTSTLSSTDTPAHGSFILATNSPFDWRSPQNTNLWQGVNGVNNPCPSGYRLPTETELNAERTSWGNPHSAGAFASPLKLPVAGYRNSSTGSLVYVGNVGNYWSSTVSSTNSRSLMFVSSPAGMNTTYRAYGRSVRCLKDTPPPAGAVGALDCGGATATGTLVENTAASGVSSEVPYTGGNGGTHSGQIVTSTGVTGLTATLVAGSFASGAGTLTYTITGIPSAAGTANFALNIGGQTCTLSRTVGVSVGSYPSGTVHCGGIATEVVDVINPITGKTWMDRNLGASRAATSSTDAQAYGDLYQWGRAADGHQCRNSSTTTILSTTNTTSHGNFIVPHNSPWDWRNPPSSFVNNPCPNGYRLPTSIEIQAEISSWSSSNAGGAFSSPLKLPRAGQRWRTSSIQSVGSLGGYWSSSQSGSSIGSSIYMLFDIGNASVSSNSRAVGFSIRCIKD